MRGRCVRGRTSSTISGVIRSTLAPTSSTFTCGGCARNSATTRSRQFGMSATASWLRNHRVEAAWAVFAAANIAVMGLLAGEDGGTVPFHFIWVSLTLLYGYTVWRVWPTAIVLTLVMASTATMIVLEVVKGPTRPDELTEVPLMAAMFCAMVWHAR